jgi:hypothetical protein
VHKRTKAGCRAEAADGVVKECVGTDGRIALTSVIVEERKRSGGCVADATGV